jgi:hypothetical protein
LKRKPAEETEDHIESATEKPDLKTTLIPATSASLPSIQQMELLGQQLESASSMTLQQGGACHSESFI